MFLDVLHSSKIILQIFSHILKRKRCILWSIWKIKYYHTELPEQQSYLVPYGTTFFENNRFLTTKPQILIPPTIHQIFMYQSSCLLNSLSISEGLWVPHATILSTYDSLCLPFESSTSTLYLSLSSIESDKHSLSHQSFLNKIYF